MAEQITHMRNCRTPKDDFCRDFNTSLYYNICTDQEKELLLEISDPKLVCDFLTLIMYVVGYCENLHFKEENDIMACVQKYGMSAGICSTVYFNIYSKVFNECFHFFASNIADFSRNNRSDSEWFWETLEKACSSLNSSDVVFCGGIQNFNKLLFNITWYLKSDHVLMVNGYVFPILSCLLLMTNTLMIVVMLQVFSNVSFKLLLGVHALVDILGPLMMSLIFFPFVGLGYYKDYMEYHWCIISSALINIVTPLLHGVSIWLLLGLTVQRYLIVKFPLKSKALGADKARNIIIIFIVSLFVLLPMLFVRKIQFLFEYEIYPIASRTDITTTIYTAYIPISAENINSSGTSYILRGIFIQIVPTSLILIFEIGLVSALRKQATNRQKLARSSTASDKSLTVNILTSCIVAGVLLIEIPNTASLIAAIVINQYGYSDITLQNYQSTLNVLTLLIYQTNLIICCCISKEFRIKLLSVFKLKCFN